MLEVKELDENLQDIILEHLPHGSGINSNWTLWSAGNKRFICENAYDYMDEYGMYDAVFPFKLVFKTDFSDFRLTFSGCSRSDYRKIERSGLREYLEYIFEEARAHIESEVA